MEQFFAFDLQLLLGDWQIEAEHLRASAIGWVTSAIIESLTHASCTLSI